MPSRAEEISEEFYRWERRGRGWQVFSEPVFPEPAFRPFSGHRPHSVPIIDDGSRPTPISAFIQFLSRKLAPPEPVESSAQEDEEPVPQPLVRDSLVELYTSLPADFSIPKESFEQFLLNLSHCREPIAFELVGVPNRVTAHFVASPADAPLVRRQLQAYFPEAVFQTQEGTLEHAWHASSGDDELVVEFGLAREFMLPLAFGKLDPFIGIIGALSELQPGELGLFQVLFQPVREPWPESILRSVTHADGKPFFVNAPELAHAAENKISKPLYAAVVRIATKAETFERALQIGSDLAGSLRVFAHPQGNELIPLRNDDYPFYDHIEDLLRRQSRRTGMLLNSDELIGFVHLPSDSVRSPTLLRQIGKTKVAPAIARPKGGILLGNNIHAGKTVEVRLSPEQRVRHTHIIGASGTGKSTLLFNLIRQDIENGEGIGVLDPHGDLIDRVLGSIPPSRIADVVLVDPSDEEYSVGLNILAAHTDLEKNLLASDLVSVFERLSASWGDQMNSVLNKAILAFLESSRGGTLVELRRFLIETDFRNQFLESVKDPEVLYYWKKVFPLLSGTKSVGPIVTRLDTFLGRKPIRLMVSQKQNRLQIGEIMNSGKIFLAKLSQGKIGRENAYLLGSFLVSKFQQAAMARQDIPESERKDFWLYVDEFPNFITPSMAEILSGTRKYHLGLVLAHQELRQMQRESEVASAVITNCGTRICFRVGDIDAKALGSGFSFFEAKDLQNLGTGEAICRVERSDADFNLTIPLSAEIPEEEARETRLQVTTASRRKYGTPRSELETILQQTWSEQQPAQKESAAPPVTEPVALSAKPSQAAEVPPPESTGHEHAQSPSNLEVAFQGPPKPQAPRLPGRGGPEHRAIQVRIKEEAAKLGFLGKTEEECLGGSVDVLLVRDGLTIACEISVTSNIDHEVGNIAKCLNAGFDKVAAIRTKETRLKGLSAAVEARVGAEAARRVEYYLPDQFIEFLQSIERPKRPDFDNVVERRGYMVKRRVAELSPEEHRIRESEAIRSIAESMQRPLKK